MFEREGFNSQFFSSVTYICGCSCDVDVCVVCALRSACTVQSIVFLCGGEADTGRSRLRLEVLGAIHVMWAIKIALPNICSLFNLLNHVPISQKSYL